MKKANNTKYTWKKGDITWDKPKKQVKKNGGKK